MANGSETGHATNVARFEKMISNCVSYRNDYNPSRESIKLTALQILLGNANSANSEVNTFLAEYKNVISSRKVAFKPLDPLITRIISALAASETSSEVIDNAKSFAHKLKGERISRKKTDEEKATMVANGKEKKEISAAQTGFNNKIDHFDRLINLLSGVPQYNPNEADLTINSLTSNCSTLSDLNKVVINAETALGNARISRNNVLYGKDTGLYDIQQYVKEYVKSVFGTKSPKYKQISKLRFTKPR